MRRAGPGHDGDPAGGPKGDDDARGVGFARPPRLAEALLARLLPAHERAEVVGDMAECHARRLQRGAGVLEAGLWYWRQALGVPMRLGWRRLTTSLNGPEVRQAARGLIRSPGFTTVAVLSLGLGIGANTAIFSIVRSLLYTPLAVDRPAELALVYYERPDVTNVRQFSSSSGNDPDTGAVLHSNYSFPAYQSLRAAVGPSIELLGYNFARRLSMVVEGRPAVSATALVVSGDYFSTLRLGTIAGRPLDESDDRLDAPRVAVISHGLWQREFGSDPAAVGRTVLINGAVFEIVGVTAPGFGGLSPGGFFEPTDVTVPFAAQAVVAPSWTPEVGSLVASEDLFWVRMIARVPEGESAAPLEEAMTAALRSSLVDATKIAPEDASAVAVRFIDGSRGLDSLRQDTAKPLAILAGVVAMVLLIACANLASLTLARGTARQHELAVRHALGAGRLRLMRQLLLESLMVAAAGGVAGILLALWSGPLITAALTAGMGRVTVRFELDGMLLATTGLVSVAAAVLCGLLPALRLSRSAAHDELRTRGKGEGGHRFALGRALIAVQIAVSIPLMVGAGLFLQTLGNLGDVELGFDERDLVIFHIDTRMVTSDAGRTAAIFRDVLSQLEAVPGVSSVTLLENALLSGWTSNTGVRIDGEETGMYMNAVGPDFFETMRIPLVSGRPILATDGVGSAPVIVVNETAERELFGGRAVGRVVARRDTAYEVVGVVRDSKYDGLRRDIVPTFYDSYLQRPLRAAHVLARTGLPPDRLEETIREIVGRADPGLPVTDVRSQTDQIAAEIGRERVFSRLLATFGGFALLVACIGLYGVTSFAVARRRAELGVRLALGAQQRQILWLVQRSVMTVAAVGTAAGLAAAYALGPVVESMLYGLEPTDTITLVSAAVVLLLVAFAAGWFPALRAARTDALIALSRD